MAKYLDIQSIEEMSEVCKRILAERETVYKKYKIDILDTDAISSLTIFKIVNQYDPDYNINFSRNGEDAKSKAVLIEQKASRVAGLYTRTGKLRKNGNSDAVFQFHAMGDLHHDRYIFVARNKEDLKLLRIYDVQGKKNCKLIQKHLENERDLWLQRAAKNTKLMKRDIIAITEKFIQEQLKLPNTKVIDGCNVITDLAIN